MDKKKAAADRLKERTASKRFKLPEGDTILRVLPNAKGADRLEYIEYGMHSNVGAGKAYLRCGKKMDGSGDCWICDKLIPKLEKTGKSSHKKAAEDLRRKDNFAVQILYMVSDKWVGPTLWEMSTPLANKLLALLSRHDVADPKKGRNLTINRTGTTLTTTKYSDFDRDDETSPVSTMLLEKLKPFSEVLRKYDEAEMKKAYYGHEQDGDDSDEQTEEETTEEDVPEDEEEEGAPAPKKSGKKRPVAEEEEEEAPAPKKSGKKKPPVEEEEEGEITEEEEDVPNLEEEEEEAPAPKKSGKKKPVRVDEEEEETTEEDVPEDEEEEGAPAPKKSGKKRPVAEEEE